MNSSYSNTLHPLKFASDLEKNKTITETYILSNSSSTQQVANFTILNSTSELLLQKDQQNYPTAAAATATTTSTTTTEFENLLQLKSIESKRSQNDTKIYPKQIEIQSTTINPGTISESSGLWVVSITVIGLMVCTILLFFGYKKIHKRSRKLNQFNYSHYFDPYYEPSLTSSTDHLASGSILDVSSIPTITLQRSLSSCLSLQDSNYYSFNSPADVDYSPSYTPNGTITKNINSHSNGQSLSNLLFKESDLMFKLNEDKQEEQLGKNSFGKINFVLHYSLLRQQLIVTLLSATNLPIKCGQLALNPFAKLCLLPEKTIKYESKIHYNNRNPVFNEMFTFIARRGTLDERRLKISLWNFDSNGRKQFIGQIVYNLSDSGINSNIINDVISNEILCPLSPVNEVATYRLMEILKTDYTRL